jgi:hypothetical protein
MEDVARIITCELQNRIRTLAVHAYTVPVVRELPAQPLNETR